MWPPRLPLVRKLLPPMQKQRRKVNEKYLSVRNLGRFQHYKNRGPIWVKLYARTLRDDQFNDLPPATRMLALYLLVVAAERDNKIPSDPAWIATECSLTRQQARAAIEQLLAVAYLVPASQLASKTASNGASENASGSASTTRAPARSYARAERREREKEEPSSVVESVERPATDDDAKNGIEEQSDEPVDMAALGFDPDDIFGDV